ncbi:MAG: hypothetical protein U0232_13695 [Thermomicrobiales bacterium]
MKRFFLGLIGLCLLLAQFAVPTGAGAAPVLTISPTSGPRGTVVMVKANGLEASTNHLVQLVKGTGNVNTTRVFEVAVASNASGALSYPLTVDQEVGAYTVRIVAIGGTVLATAPFTVVPGSTRYFPETGFGVQGRFLDYWRSHGLDLGDQDISEREALALFGYPISDEFTQRLEDGNTYTVQYFERARFEYHPENAGMEYEVLLGQFGRQIVAGVPGAPTGRVPANGQGIYFPDTGHNVALPFSTFWQRNGGLAVFGFPLSEPFTQKLEDGNTYTVQYFERARFELHPEHAGTPYEVLLGQFGRQILGPVEMPR